jgi:hypothetical protein
MTWSAPVFTVGWVLALLVLVIAVILGIMGDRNPLLGLVAILALARVIG